MQSRNPFLTSADVYLDRGWKPLPVEGKFPPVRGATGADGTVTPEKVADWKTTHAHWNVGLRAEGYVAIDVDHYGDKHGADTLAEYESRLGRLPVTWRSTSRGVDNPSGQRFYRIPEDQQLVGKIGSDIEVVQFHHRYSVVYPSIHPSGRPYVWISPDGTADSPIPNLDFDIPDLPDAWIEELSREPHADLLEGVTVIPWRQLADSFIVGTACAAVQRYAQAVMDADHLGHDETLRLALRGFMLGREGHVGVADVIYTLFDGFSEYVKSDRARDQSEPNRLFADMAETAQRKVVSSGCRCPKPGEFEFDLDESTDGVLDPEYAKLLADPLLFYGRGGTKLNLTAAAAQFCHRFPVKRHGGSSGATYIFTGDRWQVGDVHEHVYRWLAEVLDRQEFTPNKAKELADYILIHAPSSSDQDIDTRYLSCTNGLVDWRTGELRPRTRDVFVINHIPHAWRPEARPGRFAEWIESAIEPDARQAIWEVLGYAVSPVHDLKVALALTGPGGGGKSTFVNMVTQLVGPANCAALSPNDLGERFNPAELFGKTVNAAGDVGAETLRHLGRFKMVVAGDEIQAERKGRDPFRFRPRAFNLASFNVMPRPEQSDSAFWDRWLVLPFQHRFGAGKPDNYFRDVMPYDESVMEGVLVGAVRGLQNLRSRGRFDPEVFSAAKAEWRAEADPIAAFVGDHVAIEHLGKVDGSTLFQFYRDQVIEAGGMPKGRNTFYRDFDAYLKELFPGKVLRAKQGNATVFHGMKMLDDSEAAVVKWGDRGYARRL